MYLWLVFPSNFAFVTRTLVFWSVLIFIEEKLRLFFRIKVGNKQHTDQNEHVFILKSLEAAWKVQYILVETLA